MAYNPIVMLTRTKIRELLREPEALFWVFVFPVLLALALGVAFRAKGPEELPIGVQEGPGAAWVQEALAATPGLRAAILEPGPDKTIVFS